MKHWYRILLILMLALLLGIGGLSLVSWKQASGVNETPVDAPQFSWKALTDGSFISQFERYYTATFPDRANLLEWNRKLNRFYYYSGSAEENFLVLDGNTGAEHGGESLGDVEAALNGESKPQPVTPAEDSTADLTTSEQTPSETTGTPTDSTGTPQPEQTADPDPVIDEPEESEASYAGSVVVVGTRAMEIPTADDDIIRSYAKAVDDLAAALGDGVRTISLLTPNGGEFYSPESLHTGLHSQKDMIGLCYESMGKGILTVDAYSKLRAHTDEYIFFRTDHHWTQLGAYYAYTAFCEAAGFEPAALDEFETGRYDSFVGSMYTFTKGYPQSEVLKANPDYLEYYLPLYETHARYYSDATLQDGVPVSVVYTKMDDAVSNKYLCFIGGDTPVCVIESAAEGGTCLVLKESYGNALVPFLTSHYSKIIVVDPREFNRDGKPSLDLAAFAAEQGVDDLLVINYPYMINSKNYVRWLERLVGGED